MSFFLSISILIYIASLYFFGVNVFILFFSSLEGQNNFFINSEFIFSTYYKAEIKSSIKS